jgi:hypothetical protein
MPNSAVEPPALGVKGPGANGQNFAVDLSAGGKRNRSGGGFEKRVHFDDDALHGIELAQDDVRPNVLGKA